MWNADANISAGCECLADVVSISIGTGSQGFMYYDTYGKTPWHCFTLNFKETTLDIECSSSSQLTRWFMALQSLCPLSRTSLTRSKLIWKRASLKVAYVAKLRNIKFHNVCIALIRSCKEKKPFNLLQTVDNKSCNLSSFKHTRHLSFTNYN